MPRRNRLLRYGPTLTRQVGGRYSPTRPSLRPPVTAHVRFSQKRIDLIGYRPLPSVIRVRERSMAAQYGAMAKRLDVGRAAMAGIVAGRLAADGFTGIPGILDAEHGGYPRARIRRDAPGGPVREPGQSVRDSGGRVQAVLLCRYQLHRSGRREGDPRGSPPRSRRGVLPGGSHLGVPESPDSWPLSKMPPTLPPLPNCWQHNPWEVLERCPFSWSNPGRSAHFD